MASNVIAITLAVVLASGPGATPALQKVSDVPVIPREKATDEIPTVPSGASLLAPPFMSTLQQREQKREATVAQEVETSDSQEKDNTLLIGGGILGGLALVVLLGMALAASSQ